MYKWAYVNGQYELVTYISQHLCIPGHSRLRVCLDLGKLEGKKKILESSFLSIVWFEGSQKEKNREESCKET